MTAPKLATTSPAALTGRVGQGGDNRIHDVALVQALLGVRRAKGGRMYLSGDHVTGKYDRATTEALLRFRMDQRDTSIKRPFQPRGSQISKLAQGQSTVVLEGTNIAYKTANLAEPGEIKGEAAKLLSAERKVELKAVMKDFISDWGIALDVEIKVAANNLPARTSKFKISFESLPLVAHFTPRNLEIHNGRTLSSVSNNTQFQARAKALYEAVAADLKTRCIDAFGISDPVDVKIQNGLKGDFASVVRTDLEGVEALSVFILAEFRKWGLRLAARFFEHYLGASGQAIELNPEDALEFDLIKNAAQENIERFKQRNFISPEQSTPGFLAVKEIAEDPAARFTQFKDHWKVDLNFSVPGLERFYKAAKTDITDTASAFLATGKSSVTSTGDFLLRRQGDQVLVTGTITHLWTDPAYNFNSGQVFHPESKILERHGKGQPFPWQAEWCDEVVGLLEIDKPFTPYAKSRWLNFDVQPKS